MNSNYWKPKNQDGWPADRLTSTSEKFRKGSTTSPGPTTPGSWWSNRSFGGFRGRSTWGTGWCYRQGSWTRHGGGWKLGNGHQLWIAMLKPRYLPTPKICQRTLFLPSTGNWGNTFFRNTTSCRPLNHDRTWYLNAALFFGAFRETSKPRIEMAKTTGCLHQVTRYLVGCNWNPPKENMFIIKCKWHMHI